MYKILPVACLLLTAIACHKMPDDTIFIVTADPEFNVDLFEQRNAADGQPVLGVWLESIKFYNAVNYSIEATSELTNGRVKIHISGVTPPATPVAGTAPAAVFVPIGQLTDGAYNLEIDLGNTIVNKGTLTVTAAGYTLAMQNPEGLVIRNMATNRLPEGMVWGYADISNETVKQQGESFILDLKSITTDHALTPGYYSYFTVTGAGTLFFHPAVAPSGNALLFARRAGSSPDNVKQLLAGYRSNSPLPIRCLSTFGEL